MSRINAAEVARLAALARVGIHADRIPQLVNELNGILGHMDALATADVSLVVAGPAPTAGMPLRADNVQQKEGARSLPSIAPAFVDGFVLVPRLASHDGGGSA